MTSRRSAGLVVLSALRLDADREAVDGAGIPAKANRKSEAKQPVFTGRPIRASRCCMKMMRELRKSVEENADYVGDKFAEEARKIHYEEAEKRGIYGEATREDAKALVEEGIEVHPLPPLPEDGN